MQSAAAHISLRTTRPTGPEFFERMTLANSTKAWSLDGSDIDQQQRGHSAYYAPKGLAVPLSRGTCTDFSNVETTASIPKLASLCVSPVK